MGVSRVVETAACAAALVLVAAAGGLVGPWIARAALGPGPPGPAPDLPQAPGTPLSEVDRVRVIILDGLGRYDATGLDAYDAACARGWDIDVDVGFPTKSLPVQHALWTGHTHAQSGIAAVNRRVEPAITASLPGRVAGSVAVVESHPAIAGSFAFGELRAPQTPEAFAREAADAVASPAPLVFVHVLRIDAAAHRDGRGSEAYYGAVGSADVLLGELFAAAGDDEATRWFVLADHGHAAPRGHGGAEREVRIVRACVAGALGARPPGRGPIHLVDLSRALAASLGVTLEGSAGRTIEAALAEPALGATLPRPGVARWLVAVVLAAAALALSYLLARRKPWLVPLWFPLAAIAVLWWRGAPTLSDNLLAARNAPSLAIAVAPALALLALATWRGLAVARPLRVLAAQLVIPAAAAAAAAVLAGIPQRAAGLAGPSPVPVWTATASLLFAAAIAGCATVAVVFTARAVRERRS